MNDHVYVSAAYVDPTISLAASSSHDHKHIPEIASQRYYQRNIRGEVLERDKFPRVFWRLDHGKRDPKFKPLFFANSFWGVNEKAAEVLQAFDLGDTSLYEIELLDREGGTRVDGRYFLINFANKKIAFLPDHSPRALDDLASQGLWFLPHVPRDNDIVVSPAAKAGPDLWIDPHLSDCFFVSRLLGEALTRAKLANAFALRKAPILE